LVVANEGVWSYDNATGILSFTPDAGFVANPTDISYTLTEIANNITNTALVNFEYRQPPKAGDDLSENNDAGEVSIAILDNDLASNGMPLTAAEVVVDLDPSTAAVETTLSAGVLGNWSYNPSFGALTFTPNTEFSANPPVISYSVTETLTGFSDQAIATVEYKEFTVANLTVTGIGETCASENNGSIEIASNRDGNFSYQLNNGAGVSFNKATTIDNLDSGVYTLVITDADTQDIVEFNMTLSEPEDLKVSTKVEELAQKVTLDLSGSPEYTIKLNGTEFTTSMKRF